MSGWVCQWKPFWIPVEDSFKKAFVKEWVFISDEPSDEQNTVEVPVLHSTDHSDCIPVTPRVSKQFASLPWETPRSLKIRLIFWERIEAPLPPLRPRPKCNFIHPRQLSPFAERLELPFSNDEILSSCEEFDSSGTDLFASLVKMSEHEILVHHMVDIQKATAEFREASERKPATSSHKNSSSKHFATRSIVQRRLSINNWNPGPRRGKEDAFEKQIAGRWHIITLQEASDYVDHELLTNRFHVTHYAGCAVLFNKDTSTPTSMSSPSTFMTQDESYPIKSWKENRDGSYKVFFHVPHFVVHQGADRHALQCSLFISASFTPKRKALPRSSSSLFVPS